MRHACLIVWGKVAWAAEGRDQEPLARLALAEGMMHVTMAAFPTAVAQAGRRTSTLAGSSYSHGPTTVHWSPAPQENTSLSAIPKY